MEPKTFTRSEAIALLRKKCVGLVDEDHSLCQVAARLRILCGGFSQWSGPELRRRYDWIAKPRPGIARRELEDLANRWQLARQFVRDEQLSCDVQMHEEQHRVCEGWAGHTDEDLARYCEELTREPCCVVSDRVHEPET